MEPKETTAYSAVASEGANSRRIILEVRPEGVYVNVFMKSDSRDPEFDYLCLHLAGAFAMSEGQFGISRELFVKCDDPNFH